MIVSNENMKKALEMSMDELEEAIKNQKATTDIFERIFNLRKKNGELTSKQVEKANRKAVETRSENEGYQ